MATQPATCRVHVRLHGSIGRTAFNPCLFTLKRSVAVEDTKITLANVTISIANRQVTTAYKDVTLKELKESVKQREANHQNKADVVSVSLYLDTLTYKKEIKRHRAAFKAFLEGDDEAADAKSYIYHGCFGPSRG